MKYTSIMIATTILACTPIATGGDDDTISSYDCDHDSESDQNIVDVGHDSVVPDVGRIDGEAAFAMQCAACHAADGSGVENLGPDVRNPSDYGYATHVVRNGRDEMDEFASAMLAFNESALDQPTLTAMLDFLSDAPKPADGAGLYARFCTNCHAADGSGGRTGCTLANLDAATIRDFVRNGSGGRDYGTSAIYMPSFGNDLISDAELELIESYVIGLCGAEMCNGFDDDCDGNIDEDIAPMPSECGVGLCNSYGEIVCYGGSMTNTCTPSAATVEVCNNLDDDCDGIVDEGIRRSGICQTGLPDHCQIGALECIYGERICTPNEPDC